METKTDVLVIGAGPAGVVCAVTARKYYPGKDITVMNNLKEGVVPCGIPYMFGSLNVPDENRMDMAVLGKNRVNVVVNEAVKIKPEEKMIETRGGDVYRYEKLILAVGSSPIVPPVPGIEKEGIYSVHKDMEYLRNVVREIRKAKNVLVMGGGFIGIEFADELSRSGGPGVYLVEMLPGLLANSFDVEFSRMVEEKLRSNNVEILTNTRLERFSGGERVSGALLSNGKELTLDAAILGIGAVPNTKLAQDAGLETGKGIWVDEYMRTSNPDIFAVGDCAIKRDFYTRRSVPVMLASTATAEARIAGANLYQLKVVRENKGTIAIYSTYVDGLVLGSAGLTEISAKKEGFEIVVGSTECPDKHPAAMPGAGKIRIKLIFSKQSGIILGGQVAGGMSAAEVINIIGMAIQKRISSTELETLQMATHPYLTSAPTMYPLVLAAQDSLGR
ncbi:MAG: pyridine nucleotide-disulfide oxidoreductase [Candidatus Makaraimicrobium thalassicum]|nr:MAG: pyridine nucleotide-disulfide oxidoreductase [Candidatus Omnitrophota bacterium]